ncbi:hypothetical protein SUGI_1075910 [Cryptomeria japonica]|nr:hypothetical protein SUGI_1075910 [Cryptomeria japonica]
MRAERSVPSTVLRAEWSVSVKRMLLGLHRKIIHLLCLLVDPVLMTGKSSERAIKRPTLKPMVFPRLPKMVVNKWKSLSDEVMVAYELEARNGKGGSCSGLHK